MHPTPLIDPYWCFVADAHPFYAGTGTACLLGDPHAEAVMWDDVLDALEATVHPFETGKGYLIQTQTLYYVGRVAGTSGAFLLLEDASWVHWTGRLSTLVRKLSFAAAGWPSADRRPRTEYVGAVIVALPSVVAAIPGEWKLPKESVLA